MDHSEISKALQQQGFGEQSKLQQVEHVFEFIRENLINIGKDIRMAEILKMLHNSISLELQLGNTNIQLGDYILKMLKNHKASPGLQQDVILLHILQVLYQTLQTIPPENIEAFIIEDELFIRLIELMLEGNTKQLINANTLACVQLYVKKFNAINILETIWRKIANNLITTNNDAALQVLITLFDEFAEFEFGEIDNFKTTMQTTALMENLLFSEEHDKRKCAYFLLKKCYTFMPGTPQFWTTCISILENLEENQSHLILPTLELLNKRKFGCAQELRWLHVLYKKILMHNNILVRRWVLEYFLQHHTFSELPTDVALCFLLASNETSLYNVEGYMLPTDNIAHFLGNNKQKFLQAFTSSQLGWKAVPLYFWLSQMRRTWRSITFVEITDEQQNGQQLFINLASKVRVLVNVTFRRLIAENFFEDFVYDLITRMDCIAYVDFVKTLYNISDQYPGLGVFMQKLEKCDARVIEANGSSVFDQRLYEILVNNLSMEPACINACTIFDKLQHVDSISHGYLSLLVIFNFAESCEKQVFCQRHYDLDIYELGQIIHFSDLYDLLCEKLDKIVQNKILLKQRAMDFHICSSGNFRSFDNLLNSGMTLDWIFCTGTAASLTHAAKLLAEHRKKVEDNVLESMLNGLRECLKIAPVCSNIVSKLMEYMCNVLNAEERIVWVKKILELDLENQTLTENVLLNEHIQLNDGEFLIQGALSGESKTGDARIEEAFLLKTDDIRVKRYRTRHTFVCHITHVDSMALKQSVIFRICDLAKQLNLKKPRYFANSKEHRKLIRMTYLLWSLRNTKIDCMEKEIQLFEKLWSLLMKHNNQPNVTIILECLIAHKACYKTLMKNIVALKKPTSSQEVSITMLLYRFFEAKTENVPVEKFSETITFLWPLTMGSSFQTRLYAQLVIIVLIRKYLEKCKENQTQPPEMLTFLQLKNAIEQMMGEAKIKEFLEDVRFRSSKTNDFYDETMFLTQTPYDEYQKWVHHFENEKYLPTKKLLDAAKNEIFLEQQQNEIRYFGNSNCIATDVQRKLNPNADFMPQPNLISYPFEKENELYVVASFIDKIPNLGGIARTCEVLGIANLVLASKADITKADFKNLSMTAEKTLNIIEVKPNQLQNFLITKRYEGFAIIGAEQTAKSCNFVNFSFPKRSVLLLGHEKEGIPPNFLGFLDYAVEIPQFGMVRSLNVHVTGALFMWEYCKQHIYKEKIVNK